jgi:hypothetical protein
MTELEFDGDLIEQICAILAGDETREEYQLKWQLLYEASLEVIPLADGK